MKKMIAIVLLASCSMAFAADPTDPNSLKDVSWDKISKDTVKEVITASKSATAEIVSWVKSAKDFVVEQSPLVCQEILAWGRIKAIFYIGMGMVFLLITTLVSCNFWKNKQKWHDKGGDANEFKFVASILVGIATFIVGTILILVNIHGLLYVIYAPRLYLLETLSKMVN